MTEYTVKDIKNALMDIKKEIVRIPGVIKLNCKIVQPKALLIANPTKGLKVKGDMSKKLPATVRELTGTLGGDWNTVSTTFSMPPEYIPFPNNASDYSVIAVNNTFFVLCMDRASMEAQIGENFWGSLCREFPNFGYKVFVEREGSKERQDNLSQELLKGFCQEAKGSISTVAKVHNKLAKTYRVDDKYIPICGIRIDGDFAMLGKYRYDVFAEGTIEETLEKLKEYMRSESFRKDMTLEVSLKVSFK